MTERLKQLIADLEIFINDNTIHIGIKNCHIFALVEDHDDMRFWTDIFQECLPEKLFHAVRMGGSNNIIKYQVSEDQLTQIAQRCRLDKIIFCLDSDNKHFYLSEEENPLLKPATFQTYTHSLENLKTNPKILNQIYKKITLIHLLEFDFEIFIRDYSRLTYPVLLHWINFYTLWTEQSKNPKDKKHKKQLIADKETFDTIFKSIIEIGRVKNKEVKLETEIEEIFETSDLEDLSNKLLNFIAQRIQQGIQKFQKELGNYFYEGFQEEINLNLEEENTSWYLRGHSFYDCFIVPLFLKIIETTKKQEIDKRSFLKENEDKINQYIHTVDLQDPITLLYNGYKECFSASINCFFIEKIKADIRKVFS